MMPGMAASPRIFEFLNLNDSFDVICLSWILPESQESLAHYAKRMCERVEHEEPVLLGVSFGGLLVQEMAKHIKCSKVVVVSSIKSNKELPLSMQAVQKNQCASFASYSVDKKFRESSAICFWFFCRAQNRIVPKILVRTRSCLSQMGNSFPGELGSRSL